MPTSLTPAHDRVQGIYLDNFHPSVCLVTFFVSGNTITQFVTAFAAIEASHDLSFRFMGFMAIGCSRPRYLLGKQLRLEVTEKQYLKKAFLWSFLVRYLAPIFCFLGVLAYAFPLFVHPGKM